MKKISLLVMLMVLFSSVSFAFNSQTTGLVTRTYWKHGVKQYEVLIGHEYVVLNKSIKGIIKWDEVIINVFINGPEKPIVSIVYKLPLDTPPRFKEI